MCRGGRDGSNSATAEKGWQPPEARGGREVALYSFPREPGPASARFKPLALRAMNESISVVLSHKVSGDLLQQPQEMNAES